MRCLQGCLGSESSITPVSAPQPSEVRGDGVDAGITAGVQRNITSGACGAPLPLPAQRVGASQLSFMLPAAAGRCWAMSSSQEWCTHLSRQVSLLAQGRDVKRGRSSPHMLTLSLLLWSVPSRHRRKPSKHTPTTQAGPRQ